MAKKVVRGVMIIQKNADAPAHPRPPAWTRRFKRANREQTIHSLLLIRLPIAIDGEERREKRERRAAFAGKAGTRETVAAGAYRVNGFAVPAWNEKSRVRVEMHHLAVTTRTRFARFTLLQVVCIYSGPGFPGLRFCLVR